MTALWLDWINDYTLWMTAAGIAAGTLRIYRHYLLRLTRACGERGPADLDVDDLAAFLGSHDWQPETRKSARASMRSFYGWAELTGRVERNPARLLRAVRVPAGVPRPTPDDVLARGLALARTERDQLMVMLAAYAGLRRGEIAKSHTRWVVADGLMVHGKGGRVRHVPLHPSVAGRLLRWPTGYLFPGKIDGHLSADRVGHILSRLLGPGWTGHTLRHRFATLAYAEERDLLAVQQLLGHSKPETAARYTLVAKRSLTRAVMAAGPAA